MTTPADEGTAAVRREMNAYNNAYAKFDKLTLKQLRDKARKLGVPGEISKMPKYVLVDILANAHC